MCVYVCVWVCKHRQPRNILTLHHQTEDNIANEDGPRFVDTCTQLQIVYSCI